MKNVPVQCVNVNAGQAKNELYLPLAITIGNRDLKINLKRVATAQTSRKEDVLAIRLQAVNVPKVRVNRMLTTVVKFPPRLP